jgi:hypothetical protein
MAAFRPGSGMDTSCARVETMEPVKTRIAKMEIRVLTLFQVV